MQLQWKSGELSRSCYTRRDGGAAVVAWERGTNTTLPRSKDRRPGSVPIGDGLLSKEGCSLRALGGTAGEK